MPEDGFGSNLWKNAQAIEFGDGGGIEVPVRANGTDGIVIGVDTVATTDAAGQPGTPPTPGPLRRLWNRMLRH